MKNLKSVLCDIKGNMYVLEKRDANENAKFLDLLATVNSNLSEAINMIKYTSFPMINKGTIDNLEDIAESLSTIECNISNNHTCLFKPVKTDKPLPYRYYELWRFYGRKSNEKLYIRTLLNRNDYRDDDVFLAALVEEGHLDEYVADMIATIVSIDEQTYLNENEK